MRESNIEGVASRGGPEPCVVVCEGGGEASAGLLSLEISFVGGVFASRRRTPVASGSLTS